MSILVVDVGTSSVRAGIVRDDGSVDSQTSTPLLASSPTPGIVEFDATQLARAVLDVAAFSLDLGGPVTGVGIANQRATTVVWDRASGLPVAPAIGWQDLRTVGTCLLHQADGLRLAPNMSATKVKSILDAVDPKRARAGNGELCFGTIDAWVTWTLCKVHVTDATNAGVTGLAKEQDGPIVWDKDVLSVLDIPVEMMPTIVDSVGAIGTASALRADLVVCGMAGDQQASLIGQGCTTPGSAKATFGTGGMLDLCTIDRPVGRGEKGTFAIVRWQRDGVVSWGVEAIMLSAGTCIEWLRDDLSMIKTAEESSQLASECEQTSDVWFVPALLGMGTPDWDFGARGTLLGLTRGTGRAQVVRAVLEGVAHRGADLLEAGESDSGFQVDALRIDGGMSANRVFVEALANACGIPIEVSSQKEATTLGAGMLAGLFAGMWKDEGDLAAAYHPQEVIEPQIGEVERGVLRQRWQEARARAKASVPELSGIAF